MAGAFNPRGFVVWCFNTELSGGATIAGERSRVAEEPRVLTIEAEYRVLSVTKTDPIEVQQTDEAQETEPRTRS